MIHRISMMKPIHFLLLLALVIMVPIIAQDEDKPVVQEKEAVVEDESEVAVVPDTDSIPDLILKPGDIAPSWALMYAPVSYTHLTLPTICSV